jgi:hypothetical protein
MENKKSTVALSAEECGHGEVQHHSRGRVYCVKCQRWGDIPAARTPDEPGLREALEAALNGVSTYGRPLTDYMEPGLVVQLRAALSQPAEAGTCWFCKGTFPIDALIAGYDTFEESRLACLACNERMSGNWRPAEAEGEENESWRDPGLLDALRNGKPIGPNGRARILAWDAAQPRRRPPSE